MNVEYEEMIVTFIDILGFKNLVEIADPEKIQNIIELFKGINFSSLCHKTGDPNKDNFNAISVSDATIRLTRFPKNCNKSDIIINEIKVLAFIQLRLICDYKILIRGGLSIGKMCFNYNCLLSVI